MDRNELIDTIQRLIALSSSSNEHESASALARANALMAQHNISMVEIETQKVSASYSTDDIYSAGKTAIKDPFILPILKEFFFVRPIYCPVGHGKSYRQVLRFFGDGVNVQIAKYVYKVLDLLYGAFADANRIPGASRRAYYAGLMEGYRTKLREERAELRRNTANCTALVVLDKALVEAFRVQFPRTTIHSSSSIRHDAAAYSQGVSDGAKINIRQGVAGVERPKLS